MGWMMADDLAGMDVEAISEAVDLLRDAGYKITAIRDVERTDMGARWKMEVSNPSRQAGLTSDE